MLTETLEICYVSYLSLNVALFKRIILAKNLYTHKCMLCLYGWIHKEGFIC